MSTAVVESVPESRSMAYNRPFTLAILPSDVIRRIIDIELEAVDNARLVSAIHERCCLCCLVSILVKYI